MCISTYFHVVQSDVTKKICWMHLEIETFSRSDDLASEESVGLLAVPTILSPCLSRLKVFLEETVSIYTSSPCVSVRAPLMVLMFCPNLLALA